MRFSIRMLEARLAGYKDRSQGEGRWMKNLDAGLTLVTDY